MNPQDGAPEFLSFHDDERAAQHLAGQAPPRAAIRPFMPEQHRTFFAGLPYIFAAAPDERGWPTGTVLTGDVGFIRSADPETGEEDRLAVFLPEGVTFSDLQVFDVGGGP